VKGIAAALTATALLVWAMLTLRALSGPEPQDARLARTVAFVGAIAFSLAACRTTMPEGPGELRPPGPSSCGTGRFTPVLTCEKGYCLGSGQKAIPTHATRCRPVSTVSFSDGERSFSLPPGHGFLQPVLALTALLYHHASPFTLRHWTYFAQGGDVSHPETKVLPGL
jgi:hypothetical protein